MSPEPTTGAASPPGPASTAQAPAHYKRHFRNFLINSEYQLRTTAVMVVISVVLTGGLGWLVYRQTDEANRVFHVQAETAQMLKQKGVELGPDDQLALQLYEQFQRQDRNMMLVLVGFGVLLAVVLSGIGIVLTHKVAGPLYKTTIYMDRIRDGKLGQVYDLRKGDQLRDFFGHFKEMHAALRSREEAEVTVLEAALAGEQDGKLAHGAADTLRDLARRKHESLS